MSAQYRVSKMNRLQLRLLFTYIILYWGQELCQGYMWGKVKRKGLILIGEERKAPLRISHFETCFERCVGICQSFDFHF